MANNANILLHGLFFLQYQGNKLIAMAAPHHMHVFLKRHQGQLRPFDKLPEDIAFDNLLTGSQIPFPREMPQFDKTETGVGDLTPIRAGAKTYKCLVTLPLPADIVVLRARGYLKDFQPVPESVVGQNILKYSGPQMGLITLLHYETSGPAFTLSFFAEHMTPPNTDEVNAALIDAKRLFENRDKFDLKLTKAQRPIICPDNALPPKVSNCGVKRDDEHSIGEVYRTEDCSGDRGTDIANCVQFGVNG